MVDKRSFSEYARDDDDLDVQLHRPKRRLGFQGAVRDVITDLTLHDLLASLEPLLRRVVREELEKRPLYSLQYSPRPSIDPPESSRRIGLELRFINQIKQPSYTCSKIEAEGGRPIRVVLVDIYSGKKVTGGPLSSIKIELVPLRGDFNSENWTEEEFIQGITREREGRKPLITGDRIITLKNGEADVHNLIFSDNSSWSRNGMFRLGARASNKACAGERIKEALSEPFPIKDHRGETYEKHYPPKASDEVWRLDEISRDGKRHKRLAELGIHTVELFLRRCATDPDSLRDRIGNGTPLSDRIWNRIIDHANTCTVHDAKIYQYSLERIQILLNSIYRVVGATFDGENYLSPENFNPYQKNTVEILKQQAFQDPKNLVLLEATEAVSYSKLLMNKQPEPSITPSIGIQATHPSTLYAFQDDVINQFIGSSAGQSSNQVQESSFTSMNSFRMPDANENCIGNNWFPAFSQGIIFGTEHPTPADISLTPDFSSNYAIWSEEDGYSNNAAEGDLSSILSAFNFDVTPSRRSMGWLKIYAAVKWGISIRKHVAEKRKLAPLPLLLQT